MKDLGTLAGDSFSIGVGINDNGDIVGGSFDVDWNERAFIWHNGVMTDLNTRIPIDSPLFLIEAEDLNSRGQIIGVALEISSGEIHAFVATPREDGDLHNESDLAAASRQPQITLPESTRKLIQRRLSSLRLRRPIMK